MKTNGSEENQQVALMQVRRDIYKRFKRACVIADVGLKEMANSIVEKACVQLEKSKRP